MKHASVFQQLQIHSACKICSGLERNVICDKEHLENVSS